MTRCDDCAQCVHGRPKGGWPGEESTWVKDCRDFNKAVSIMPFGGYKDFDECVRKNQDKADPKAYCGAIKAKVENEAGQGDDEDMADNVSTTRTRMFDAPFGPKDNFVSMGDGGLLVKDIVIMAEGTWTDSLVGSPLHYSAKVLSRDAQNWASNGIWSRHTGGKPRSITDKVGEVRNPRFSMEHKAVIGDGFFHGRTQASRDVIELIKGGMITDVSAEVGGREDWDASAKRYEAASTTFYGFALVDKGACNVCKMRRNEAGELVPDDDADETREGEVMAENEKIAELEKKVADLESEKAEIVKELAASKEKLQADEKAHSEKLATLTKELESKDARVKELEKEPITRQTVGGDTASDSDRELAEPPMRVVWRNGECMRL